MAQTIQNKLTLVNFIKHGCEDEQRVKTYHAVCLLRVKGAIVAWEIVKAGGVVATIEVVG